MRRSDFKSINLLLGAILFVSVQASANEFYQFSVGAGSEDNVPRGLLSMDELDSEFFRLQFLAGKLFQLGLNDTLTISGQLSATRFNKEKGFDTLGAGVSLDFAHRFGFGAYAPRLGAVLSYNREDWQGRARDNDVRAIELYFEKRLSPAWFVAAGIDYQDSNGKSLNHHPMLTEFGYDENNNLPYQLYDYEATSTFAELEYTFENGFSISGAYRLSDGYVVSSTLMPTHHLYKISEAFYIDPAFDIPWYAYQLEADTHAFSSVLSVPVSRDASINLEASWFDIRAKDDRDYDNRILSVTYVHSF